MYFDVEQETGTATVSPTSAVVTSTLKSVTYGTSSASSSASSSTPSKSADAAIRPVEHSVVVALPAAALVLLASYMCL